MITSSLEMTISHHKLAVQFKLYQCVGAQTSIFFYFLTTYINSTHFYRDNPYGVQPANARNGGSFRKFQFTHSIWSATKVSYRALELTPLQITKQELMGDAILKSFPAVKNNQVYELREDRTDTLIRSRSKDKPRNSPI